MEANLPIFISRDQNLKFHFSKRIFQLNFVQSRRIYIYIVEIRLEKNYFVLRMAAKTFFVTTPKIQISANYRGNGAVDLFLMFLYTF